MRFLQGIVPHLSNLDLRTPADTKQLVSWFINDASESLTLDPALIQPAAARLGEGRTSCAAIATRPADQEIKVAVIAPLRAISEVEASGRMTFAALLASGVAVEMWETSDPDQADQAPVHIICMSDDQMAGKSRPALAARSDVVRILVPIGHLARFPDAAMPALSLVDEVWAPSRFIQLALAARTNSPVIHMPLAVEVGPVVPMARDRLGLPEDRFTFLSVFDGRPNLDRTNACSAIRAFRQAFPQRGRACLVLASGPRSLTSEERAILDAAIDGNGDIRVLDQPLNYGAMSNLIAACDAMLSLHRSEGLGLAIAHAMLRRRPVIAPRYAATGEYVTSSTGYPVDYLLVPAVDGGCWADVDTSHAAWIMARLVNEPQGAAMLIDKAYDYVEQQHSRKNVAARLKARLATLAVRR
jgi:glycosyltransferase involved in cell wall biosynthesis